MALWPRGVVHHDVHAIGRQTFGDGLSDAARSARDNGHSGGVGFISGHVVVPFLQRQSLVQSGDIDNQWLTQDQGEH